MEAVKEQEEPDSGSEDYTDSESENDQDEVPEQAPADELQIPAVEGESSKPRLLSSIDLESGPTSSTTIDSEKSEPSLLGTLAKLKLEDPNVSDLSDTQLSRSPPQSRRGEVLPEEESDDETDKESTGGHRDDVKAIVAADITKIRAQQQRKYHSKRSTRNAGRAHGSKAKQDTRVKLSDHGGGFWG